MNRRELLTRLPMGIGVAALSHLFGAETKKGIPGLPGLPHFAAKAKRVILLHQSGGPSQMDLFDYKPGMKKYQGVDLPNSVRNGQRITGMTSGQATFPVASSMFQFQQYGQTGTWVSELLPHTAKIVDELALIKTVHTEAINHDPAITFFQSGSQQPGRPSIGAWVSYGLGSENENLPAFVVMVSQAHAINTDQPLFSRLWGSGFLPSNYQGVKFRASADPVLYLSDPKGITKQNRRSMLDAIGKLNEMKFQQVGDPEIETRITQYEMAYRMQTSVPELVDLSKEPESTFEMYGPESKKPGSYARNCLLARRLAERGVRFIQLYHRGWDQHNDLPRDLALQCRGTDQPTAALVADLKQRGLLEDTLVVWGGEFGRTVYCQGRLSESNYGRDHHPRNFCMWMAGGGVKAGARVGETDDFSYNIVQDPVHVHDMQATILRCLGIDHKKLTYQFQGRHFRLTDVHGELVEPVLS
ncbi:DUF1501 domain-containing protein [Paludibaculum fermentans]|uniref:DUF1501 domain-containing protein n=1 Tax=Paludibaculum fermentans TaxID=1473598 RepID=A0A7S7SL30_PALFE|nr:DUF1501 domain-containing protein [Paludibaculum fermentans]QOY88959.1 DUF1501 domain-containing protein [Paludibaculum fermentans]